MGIIQGKAYWAKVDPNNPSQMYNTTGPYEKQWTVDITLDETAGAVLQSFDMDASLRDGSQEAVDDVEILPKVTIQDIPVKREYTSESFALSN